MLGLFFYTIPDIRRKLRSIHFHTFLLFRSGPPLCIHSYLWIGSSFIFLLISDYDWFKHLTKRKIERKKKTSEWPFTKNSPQSCTKSQLHAYVRWRMPECAWVGRSGVEFPACVCHSRRWISAVSLLSAGEQPSLSQDEKRCLELNQGSEAWRIIITAEVRDANNTATLQQLHTWDCVWSHLFVFNWVA